MIVVNLSKYANNIFNIFFRKGTLLPELSDEIGYCPECPAGDVQWPAESKKDLEKYKRHVKTSKHTDYGIGKKVLWNCGMCETECVRFAKKWRIFQQFWKIFSKIEIKVIKT